MHDHRRYPLRYGSSRIPLTILGLGPARSGIEVAPDRVRVRMGWAFRAEFDRAAVAGAEPARDQRWGIGVHGWRGTWLVNGSVTGIVELRLHPPVRARVVGVPVGLRRLYLSVAEPPLLLAALAQAPPP